MAEQCEGPFSRVFVPEYDQTLSYEVGCDKHESLLWWGIIREADDWEDNYALGEERVLCHRAGITYDEYMGYSYSSGGNLDPVAYDLLKQYLARFE